MEKDSIQRIVLDDIKQAKNAKKEVDEKVDTWLNEYEGKPYGVEQKGRSQIVVKDIKKAVESYLPNAVEPFISKNRLVRLEGVTAEDVETAQMHERLLNYQFVRKFDRDAFISQMFKVSATEGTVNIRTGWERVEDETVENFNGITQEQLPMFEEQGLIVKKIVDNEDGTFNVTVSNITIKENKPTAEIIRNGRFYPDPSGDKVENCRFIAYDYDSTMSDLKESEKYDDEDLEDIKLSGTDKDSLLETNRDSNLRAYGKDDTYESKDPSNKKVTVTEYFGYLDLDEDGIAEPVMVTLVDGKILEAVDNPYPDKELPFVSIKFSEVPYAFWGNAMAEFISDNQKVRTSLMRAFIDNVAQSNNGKKYVRKNSLDPINKRKHENNLGGTIEVNGDPRTDIYEGQFNQINPSMFNLYELVQQETEGLSGMNRTMAGVDSKGLNDTATGASIQQSMSQKRVIDIVRRHSSGLKKLFRKWISYNSEFLSDEEVMRINGEFVEFKRDDISGEFDIDISFNVDGVTEAKVNQMSMLIQQVGGLASVASIPPQFFNMILGKMADEWGYPDIAMMLEKPEPKEPNPMEQKVQQLEIEAKELENEETKSKAILNMSKANESGVNTKMNALGITNETGNVNKTK